MSWTLRWLILALLALTLLPSFGAAPLVAAEPLHEYVDAQIRAGWEKQQIESAAVTSDAAFLRRIYLDLVGVIPTYDETVAFLADKQPQKRQQVIDRLLEDPRHFAHQAHVWDLALVGRDPVSKDADVRPGFLTYLEEQFKQNRPYDELVRELLLAPGNSVEQGAPVFYLQYGRGDAEEIAVGVTRLFLGVQLQCARCHDHPYEDWKQTEFYGVAAFFARLEPVEMGKAGSQVKWVIGEHDEGEVLFTGPAIEQKPGQKGEPIQPKFLGGEVVAQPELGKDFKPVKFASGKQPPAPTFSRKQQIAEWIVAEENPYFAKAAVNRVWGQLIGRGLIHPVDNLSPSNVASHPELLDRLTAEFRQHNYDIRWLMRELLLTQTYQLASSGPSDEPMPRWFEQGRVRPLTAEELTASLKQATLYNEAVKATGKDPADTLKVENSSHVMRYFGRPTNGEGEFQGNLFEHLYVNNGSEIRSVIKGPAGSLWDTLVKSDGPWEDRVDRLFLTTLNRPPEPEERAKFVAYLSAADNKETAVTSAVWTLVSGSEFRFNH